MVMGHGLVPMVINMWESVRTVKLMVMRHGLMSMVKNMWDSERMGKRSSITGLVIRVCTRVGRDYVHVVRSYVATVSSLVTCK